MASLHFMLLNSITGLCHRLRRNVYKTMARQTLDWSPNRTPETKENVSTGPVEFDFSVSRKNRLHWARRRADQKSH